MGSSGHGCSSVRMPTPTPHADTIRSANTEGNMKRSPMIAIASDMSASLTQGNEALPERARGKPGFDIGGEHLLVVRRKARIRGLRFAEMRRHPVIGAGGHVPIAPGCDRGDHRSPGGTRLFPVA